MEIKSKRRCRGGDIASRRRWSGRLNLDYRISERITFKPKTNATYTTNDNRQHGLYDIYLSLPWEQ